MAVAKDQIRQIITENNITSVADVYSLLKDSFKDILQELLEAEMDATLGYEKIVRVILRAIIRGMATLPKHSKASTGNSRSCFLASNFPHFHRYDSLKSALYIHAVSKNINTFPKNQGRIRAAIAVEILDLR